MNQPAGTPSDDRSASDRRHTTPLLGLRTPSPYPGVPMDLRHSLLVRLHQLWSVAIAIALAIMLALTAVMLVLHDRDYQQGMKEELLNELADQLDDLAKTALDRLLATGDDQTAIVDLAQQLDGTVASIVVYDRSGTVLHAPRYLHAALALIPQHQIPTWWQRHQLDLTIDHRVDNFAGILSRSGFAETPMRMRYRLLPRSGLTIGCGRAFAAARARIEYLNYTANLRLGGWLVLSLLVFVAIWLASAWLLKRQLRRTVHDPLTTLAGVVDDLGHGKLDRRVDPTGVASEIVHLGVAINRMAGRLDLAQSELKRLHNELEQRVAQRTAELTVANQELESFSYSVSHDLRSPLRSIDGFAAILAEDLGDHPEARAHLERIRAAATRMGALIDDLLRLARFSRGDLTVVQVDISQLAHQAIEHHRRTQPERRVEVVITPNLGITGDEGLMRVVIENLISNAWKYTAQRPIAHLSIEPADEPGFVGFRVRDDGIGFDPEHAGKLFTPFQRLHTRQEFPGNGIGLATVARILRRHGGRITAEAKPDQGATFTVLLPNSQSTVITALATQPSAP